MKNKIMLFILSGIMIYTLNSCKDSSTDNPPGNIVADETYYPVNEGTSYKYDIENDSSGTQSSGSRATLYNGTQGIYQVQIDSVTLSLLTTTSISYFRKSDTGVFFFLDTTGLSGSIEGIDTLIQYLTIDTELRLLYLPLSDNDNWLVFKINLNYMGIINFNPIEVNAAYDGTETLTLGLTSGSLNVEAVKIKYTLKFQTDPFASPQNFTAYGWIAKDIGFVKWEGNSVIVGAFTGGGINFADTTGVTTQNLVQYNIGN